MCSKTLNKYLGKSNIELVAISSKSQNKSKRVIVYLRQNKSDILQKDPTKGNIYFSIATLFHREGNAHISEYHKLRKH